MIGCSGQARRHLRSGGLCVPLKLPSPVYWCLAPGQTKCILDNLFSPAAGDKDVKGKKIGVISCCEEDDMTVFDHAAGPFDCAAALMGWEIVGKVLVPAVNGVGDIQKTDGCARAADLAKKL